MKQKLGCLLLAVLLMAGGIPSVSGAQSDFVIVRGVLTEYRGPGGDVVIPDGVTEIGARAFYECDTLTGLVVPDSVTSIGELGVGYCTKLTKLTLPEGLSILGRHSFMGCSALTEIQLPSRLQLINWQAFAYCTALKSVDIPAGTISIGSEAFLGCTELSAVTIPTSVTGIGSEAFKDTPWLAAQGDFPIVNGYLLAYHGPGGDVKVPEGVKNVGMAFMGLPTLTSMTLPDSLTVISNMAFQNCTGLTSVTVGGSLEKIGTNAFYGCNGLKSITLPATVYDVGRSSFEGCDGIQVYLPVDLTDKLHTMGIEKAFGPQNSAVLHTVPSEAVAEFMKKYGEGLTYVGDQAPAPVPTAYASTQIILLDGKEYSVQAYALKNSKGNETNYVKLRDVAYLLNGTAAQFNVAWSEKWSAVELHRHTPYQPNGSEMSTPYTGDQPYSPNHTFTFLDGSSASPDSFLITHESGGYTYFQLRELGQILGFDVRWNPDTNQIEVDSTKAYTGM